MRHGGLTAPLVDPQTFTARGEVASALVVGPAEVTVTADALEMTTATGAASWTYPEVLGMSMADYAVVVRTASGEVVVSRLGYDTEPFYQHLLAAYNDRVRESLFVTGAPVVRAHGGYAYDEAGQHVAGTAPIEVHDDALLVLPPGLGARRVPLCFVDSVESFDYQLCVTLTTGERYTVSRLGYETEPVERAIAAGQARLHAQAVTNVRELDPSLAPDEASAVARLLLAGLAAPVGALRAIAPRFVAALEAQLATTRAAETYPVFRELCDPDEICVGFTKVDPRAAGDEPGSEADPAAEPGADAAAADDDATDEASDETPEVFRLWLIAPARAGGTTAVEFAGRGHDAAATFVYRHDGPGAGFATGLNRALEAVGFAREPLRLDDAALAAPRYSKYRMAVQRNPALQMVRQCLVARVVHRGTWRQSIDTYLNA